MLSRKSLDPPLARLGELQAEQAGHVRRHVEKRFGDIVKSDLSLGIHKYLSFCACHDHLFPTRLRLFVCPMDLEAFRSVRHRFPSWLPPAAACEENNRGKGCYPHQATRC